MLKQTVLMLIPDRNESARLGTLLKAKVLCYHEAQALGSRYDKVIVIRPPGRDMTVQEYKWLRDVVPSFVAWCGEIIFIN